MIESLLSPELTRALGWTLVHTLWQAAAFSVLLAVLLLLLRRYSALSRYVVAIGVLAVYLFTAGLTFAGLYQPSEAVESGEVVLLSGGGPGQAVAPKSARLVTPAEAKPPAVATANWRTRIAAYYEAHLPLIVTLWLLGVLVLQLRLLGQLAFLQRLKHHGAERIPAQWLGLCQELEDKLGISRPVRYLQSLRVRSPFTIGWLRPAVLFPAGLLAELNPRQVRSILAHELSHVKRYDFPINLLQSLLCILFFYHPAVWWMSARVEEEREHCCDDLAVAITGEKIGYAQTLMQLHEQRLGRHKLTMNISGKGFSGRIRRLLGQSLNSGGTYGEGFTTAVIIFASIFLAIQLTGQDNAALTQVQSEERVQSATAPPPPPAPASAPNLVRQAAELERQAHALERQAAQIEREARQIERREAVIKREADAIVRQFGRTVEAWHPDGPATFEDLMAAIYAGEVRFVQYLLEDSDIDLNQTDKDRNFSPLMAAASENMLEISTLLVEKGANINFANSEGWTALIEAADAGSSDVLDFLIERGAEVNHQSNGGASALVMAASEGHTRIITGLVMAGADIFMLGDRSPFLAAAEEGNLQALRTLLSLGAEADVADSQGRTALLFGAAEGQLDVIDFLLKQGANPNRPDNKGRTPLLVAAGEGETAVVQRLLRAGIDPDQTDGYQRTALMYAAAEGELETTRALLTAGADRRLLDKAGRTAYDYALTENELDIAELLR